MQMKHSCCREGECIPLRTAEGLSILLYFFCTVHGRFLDNTSHKPQVPDDPRPLSKEAKKHGGAGVAFLKTSSLFPQ